MNSRKVAKNAQPPTFSRGPKTPLVQNAESRGNTRTRSSVNRLRTAYNANGRLKTKNKLLDEVAAPVKGKSVIQDTNELPYNASCKIYTSEAYRDMDMPHRPLTNKACNVAPESQDFAQLTKGTLGPSPDPGGSVHDQYRKLLLEQYGFDPLLPETAKLLQQVLCNRSPKIENSSQCANPDMTTNCTNTLESPWHCVESVEEVDRYLGKKPHMIRQYNYSQILGQSTPIFKHFPSNSTPTPFSTPILPLSLQSPPPQQPPPPPSPPKEIYISEEPRIKVIAEKYVRFKKKNLEIRQFEERIVCVEFDVYNAEDGSQAIQVMRSFFSVTNESYKRGVKDIPLKVIPSELRKNFNITEQELNETAHEIEIIDSTVPGNKAYIEDLKKVLKKQREIYTKKNTPSLDLKALYNMAKRELPSLDHDFSNTNLLSKAELAEIRELLKKSTSGNRLNRNIVKPKSSKFHLGQLSESILAACI